MADAATTSERSTLSRGPMSRVTSHPVKANAILYKGTLCMIDAAGLAIAGAAATTLTPGGRVLRTVDATGAADGAKLVELDEGIFKYTNAEAGNAFALAETNLPAYCLNNQTVSKTASGLSKCGKMFELDADGGVWVQIEKGIV